MSYVYTFEADVVSIMLELLLLLLLFIYPFSFILYSSHQQPNDGLLSGWLPTCLPNTFRPSISRQIRFGVASTKCQPGCAITLVIRKNGCNTRRNQENRSLDITYIVKVRENRCPKIMPLLGRLLK